MHRDQSPVGDDAGDAQGAVCSSAGDEVLHRGGVEELNVREGEDFGKEGGCEESLIGG
jgi:hypothetical protein